MRRDRRRLGCFGGLVYFSAVFCFGGVSCFRRFLRRFLHLIHGVPRSGPESGHTERRTARKTRLSRPFSFIRTLTVGFGIAPNLPTLPLERKALAGLGL